MTDLNRTYYVSWNYFDVNDTPELYYDVNDTPARRDEPVKLAPAGGHDPAIVTWNGSLTAPDTVVLVTSRNRGGPRFDSFAIHITVGEGELVTVDECEFIKLVLRRIEFSTFNRAQLKKAWGR